MIKVSPVDGKVLYFGKLDKAYNMEQVKGVRYSLVSFCGPKHPLVREIIRNKEKLRRESNNESKELKANSEDANSLTSDIEDSSMVMEPNELRSANQQFDISNSSLYYCILYLAPGDYHWFHSPTDWTIEHRRHVPGNEFFKTLRAHCCFVVSIDSSTSCLVSYILVLPSINSTLI